MRLGIGVITGVGAIALVIAACSDSGAPSSSSSSSDLPRTGVVEQAIQGGVDAPGDRFAVGLCRSGFAGRCTAKCSGALILPNLVATARHCVSQSPQQIDCSSENPSFGGLHSGTLVITTNGAMSTAGTVDGTNTGWYSVKTISLPPDAHLCGNDIALVTLNKAVPATEAKPIIPGVQYFMWDPIPNYTLSFAAIGFGLTSPSPNPDTAGIRRKKVPINVICIPKSDRRECPEDAKIPLAEFVGGDGICSGDSGSSAYESTSYNTGATPISFGVLSRGGESGTSCKGSVYTRFDQHRQWVVDIAQQASNNWSLYPKPTWTDLKPEPVRQQTEEPDGGTGKPKVGLGETCTGSRQCESNLCIDTGAGGVCSKICDSNKEEAPCPEGFSCVDSQCLKGEAEEPAAAPPPATTTTITKEGCSAAPASRASFTSSAWLLIGLAGLLARRSRRQSENT
jgi:MYXO-CTERM domain-containing protein